MDAASAVSGDYWAISIRNEWLADLLGRNRERLVGYWLESIRAAKPAGYESLSDEQLLRELPSTVDSMIHTLATGDEEGPRQHSIVVVRRRLKQDFAIIGLHAALYELRNAVMRVVDETQAGIERRAEALATTSDTYYRVSMIVCEVYEELRQKQNSELQAVYELSTVLSRTLDLSAVLDAAVRKSVV